MFESEYNKLNRVGLMKVIQRKQKKIDALKLALNELHRTAISADLSVTFELEEKIRKASR